MTEPSQQHGPHYVRIEPSNRWQFVNWRELWRYRDLLGTLALRDIRVRYKQAVLGVGWAVLQPAALVLVFSVFLGRLGGLSGGELPYPIFVLSGLILWTFFANSLTLAANSVLGSERLITKIYFPRLAIPLAAIATAVFDFTVTLVLMGVLLAVYGIAPSPMIVLIPVFFLIAMVMSSGLGIFLAALTVSYRDFRYVTPFMVQLGIYSTPSIYMTISSSTEPNWYWLNPLVPLVDAFRGSLVGTPIPWLGVVEAAVVAVIVLVLGCSYFRKVEDEFADRI